MRKIIVWVILHWCNWNFFQDVVVTELTFRHASREPSRYTAFLLNRSSRKLSLASKYAFSTDGNLACSHFIDLKGSCFSKLNWSCLTTNTLYKKQPPSTPTPLQNQGIQMSKSLNVKGKGQNRKVRSFKSVCMFRLLFTSIAFPIVVFQTKYKNNSA